MKTGEIASCPNCGSVTVNRYCADCGQAAPRPEDYSFRAHATDLLEQLTSADSKTLRTVWALVSRPGLLTRQHIEGRRARYLRPLQLFFLVNVLLFLAAPRMPLFNYSLDNYLKNAPPSPALVRALVKDSLARSAIDRTQIHGVPDSVLPRRASESFAARFDRRVETQRKSLLILFIPGLALILQLVLARRREVPGAPRSYGEHLVFAFHSLSFVWLAFTAWGLIAAAFSGRTVGPFGLIGAIAVLLAPPVYLFLATRRVYLLSRLGGLALTLVLVAAFMGLLLAYRSLLFFATYYTL